MRHSAFTNLLYADAVFSFTIDHRASAGVYQHHAVSYAGKRRFIDHVMGLRRQRAMLADDVRSGKKIVEREIRYTNSYNTDSRGEFPKRR